MPAPIAKDTWTWWIEGGAFNTAGGDANLGGPGLGFKPHWGPEGAIGFDWQPFAPMHVVGQFRYGSASKSQPFALSIPPSFGTSAKTAGSQNLREDHWLVDFAIGRDFGVGNGNAQWKLGVRVADLRAKLTANGNFAGTFGGSPTATPFTLREKSEFLGAGPRLGVEGSIPLGGQWSLDWLAGAAVLFGHRELKITASTPNPPISVTQDFSNNASVFNLDAQAGLSYWISPTLKISASYRFDGYWNALRTFNTAGNTVNADRFYNGPMVRVTAKY